MLASASSMTRHTLWAMRMAGRVPPAMLWLATAPEAGRPVTQPAVPGESGTLLLAIEGQGGTHDRPYARVAEIASPDDVSAITAALGGARDAGFTKVDIALAPAECSAGRCGERVAIAIARHLGFTQVTARHGQAAKPRPGVDAGAARATGSLRRALRLAQALAPIPAEARGGQGLEQAKPKRKRARSANPFAPGRERPAWARPAPAFKKTRRIVDLISRFVGEAAACQMAYQSAGQSALAAAGQPVPPFVTRQ